MKRIIGLVIIGLIFAGAGFAANITIPSIELTTYLFRDTTNDEFVMITDSELDILIEGGYKFGGKVSIGFDGFIIEGCSKEPVVLEIIDGQARLVSAGDLWGKTVPETEDILKQNSDRRLTIASIGPGGENLVRYAAIMNNTHRAVGRTGLGAVMGSKKLKAIVCAGKSKFDLADPAKFKTTAKRQIDLLDESMLKVGFEASLTPFTYRIVNLLKSAENEDYYDYQTDFNPFNLGA